MKKISLMLLGLLLLLASGKAYAMAQITMTNRSQLTLNLYIDGNFACGPVLGIGRFTNSPGLFCTSSITPGPHQLEARDGEKVVAHEDNINIGDGTSPVWTVTIENPDEELIRSLNGTKYFFRSNRNAYCQYEATLEIKGTILIWTTRYVWAMPDMAEALNNGTGGFQKCPVGTWCLPHQIQIVGREARGGDQVFTVSEDGNSIIHTASDGTVTYRRQ